MNYLKAPEGSTISNSKKNKISPDHYAKYTIEPFEFIIANELDYCQGNILKYIMRYQDKNGTEDLYKAQWYLNKLIAKSINKDK
tara:strand:- start:1624 stop:1875 length:252 start_codon:yes stop_codon:yes gene_type:complete